MVQCDILVIGAGAIGSSVAWHLARLGAGDVRVVDFDLEGTLSSSELNAGGVRATLGQPVNIEASKRTIDYFATVADDVGYKPCGYLWLHAPERVEGASKARERQQAMGWEVQAWDLDELKRRVPFIDKTDGIAAAFYGVKDGLVNPNLLKNHFRAKARELGVRFEDRVLVREASGTAQGWSLRGERFGSGISQDDKIEVYSGRVGASGSRERVEYRARIVVNCAGAWAPELARILGYPCPSFPVRRQISMFDCRGVDLTPYGMVIDTSGVYFHPEATYGLSGFCNRDEPRGINYAYDGETFFNEQIWPALYERSTAFEQLKHLNGWAGQYEVSPDESAIIGAVELGAAGRRGGVFEAHSFSGHGVMHSYAAGLGLAEKIVLDRYETMDFSSLAGSRFETGKLVHEGLVI